MSEKCRSLHEQGELAMSITPEQDPRERRFIEFISGLYTKHPECFDYDHSTWTERYAGEDGIFAVYIRTLMWNETESRRIFQDEFGGYEKARNRFLDIRERKFDDWVNKIMLNIKFGADGPGAHRDNRHKKHAPRALRDYFNLMKGSQIRFFNSSASFDALFNRLKTIHSLGDLTAFDILERLKASKHHFIKVYPEKYYKTGGGVERSLQTIYQESKNCDLEKYGNELLQRIFDRTHINPEIAFFSVESILCLCQKKDTYGDYEKLLSGEETPEAFAEIYARTHCLDREKRRAPCT